MGQLENRLARSGLSDTVRTLPPLPRGTSSVPAPELQAGTSELGGVVKVRV